MLGDLMARSRFVVTGFVSGRSRRSFSIELEAESDRHALSLAYAKIGSRYGVRMGNIEISEVKKA